MDERSALGLLAGQLEHAGDDAAVVDGQVITTDMLHDATDFPAGTTRYTAGWRAVAASLSDVAAMGAAATAAVAIYAAPTFDEVELTQFVAGASDVCEAVDARYVGGDLDEHEEFTVATTALGATEEPIRRDGAAPGDALCVTGDLGRSAAALRLFRSGAGDESAGPLDGTEARDDAAVGKDTVGDGAVGTADTDADDAAAPVERANELFRFAPRVAAGRALADHATAMMDVSDGLARSVHQLAEASGCGATVDSDALPIHDAVDDVATDPDDRLELGAFFGEDFELLCTIPPSALEAVREDCPVPLARVGTATESGVSLDDEPMPDRGFTHGND